MLNQNFFKNNNHCKPRVSYIVESIFTKYFCEPCNESISLSCIFKLF